MKKLILFLTMFCFLFSGTKAKLITVNSTKTSTGPSDTVPENAKKLIHCYSDFIISYVNNYIIFKDGSKLIWDDGKSKTRKELIDKPDLEDMFFQKYPIGSLQSIPAFDSDPGRVRNKIFFQKIYGSTQKKVSQNLTEIVWCPKLAKQKIRVTKLNGVDKRLIQISKELDEHPELKKYISNIGGAYYWRNISGTIRLSTHSFGIAIDINTAYSDYWQWNSKSNNENTIIKYRNKIPQLIVEIFEKNGFVWGGKWYHYDTMHFEYRPELL